MSLKLIHAWKIDKEHKHTAIDDLESFVWVLFWSILEILKSKGALENPEERNYRDTMISDDLAVLEARGSFLNHLKDQERSQDFSTGFEPFHKLLVEWLTLAQNATQGLSDGKEPLDIDRYAEHAEKTYEKYVSIGLQNIPRLPKNWNYVKEGNDDDQGQGEERKEDLHVA
jgi:hypothetical protein